jgi:hypothetical protein
MKNPAALKEIEQKTVELEGQILEIVNRKIGIE